jgi:hypothetical protein
VDGEIGQQHPLSLRKCALNQVETRQRHGRIAQASQAINQDFFY